MNLARVLTPVAVSLALAAGSVQAISEAGLARLNVPPEPAVVDIADILSGGPPPQGIPAIGFAGLDGVAGPTRQAAFVSQDEAADWLADVEPVILVREGGEARISPLQILTWHEIVNDTLGGVPVAVTFCPLCNSALAFDRRVPLDDDAARAIEGARGEAPASTDAPAELRDAYRGQFDRDAPEQAVEVTFGVSGLLLNSNMLMFDDATATLWSQLTGEGAVGPMAGARLVRYPAQIVGFAEARESAPDAMVLSRETGFQRNYGTNPYFGYDRIGSPAFLFDGTPDGRLDAKARVITVDGETPVAYPFDHLAEARVVHDEVGGEPLVAFWAPGAATALGASRIASAEQIGSVGVFRPVADGRTLRFVREGDAIVDRETGSRWDVTGRAVAGPLEGTRLTPVAHDNTLWFAWAAFRTDTEVRRPPAASAR